MNKDVMGRKEKPIDWDLVDELLIANCEGTEIAPHFNMHHDTFYKRFKDKYNISFTVYCSEKRAHGNSLLRYTQFCKAIGKTKKGDTQLLMHLGKHLLNQRDNMLDASQAPLQQNINNSHEFMKLKNENFELKLKLGMDPINDDVSMQRQTGSEFLPGDSPL